MKVYYMCSSCNIILTNKRKEKAKAMQDKSANLNKSNY